MNLTATEIRGQLKLFVLELNKRIESFTSFDLNMKKREIANSIRFLYYWRAVLLFALESYSLAALDCLSLILQFDDKIPEPLIRILVLGLYRKGLTTTLDSFLTTFWSFMQRFDRLPGHKKFYEFVRGLAIIKMQQLGSHATMQTSVFLDLSELFWFDPGNLMSPKVYNGTALVDDDIKGLKFVAAKKFKKGEALVPVDKPLLAICDRSEHQCDHCLTPLYKDRFVVCKECQNPKYCSVDCQKAAWNQYHEVLCNTSVQKSFVACQSGLTSTSNLSIASIRLFGTALRFRCDILDLPLMKYLSLPKHRILIGFDNMRTYANILKETNQLFNPKYALWKFLIVDGKLMSNMTGSIHETFVYGTKSMLNHSCVPTIDDNLRATKTLQPGDELTITFGKASGKKMSTQRALGIHMRYGFVCDCEKCRREHSTADTWKLLIDAHDMD